MSAMLTIVQLNVSPIDVDAGATLEDSFGCTFHDEQVTVIAIVGLVNGHLIFVRRVEWQFAHFGVLLSESNDITNLQGIFSERMYLSLSRALLLPRVRYT